MLLPLLAIACAAEVPMESPAANRRALGSGLPAGKYRLADGEPDPFTNPRVFNFLSVDGQGGYHRELLGFDCELPPCPTIERRDGKLRVSTIAGQAVLEFLDVQGNPVDSFTLAFASPKLTLTDRATQAVWVYELAPVPKSLAQTPDKALHVEVVNGGGPFHPIPIAVRVSLDGCFDNQANPSLRATFGSSAMFVKFAGGFNMSGPICQGPSWQLNRPTSGALPDRGDIVVSDASGSARVRVLAPFADRAARLAMPADTLLHRGQPALLTWTPSSDVIDRMAGVQVAFQLTGQTATDWLLRDPDVLVGDATLRFTVPANAHLGKGRLLVAVHAARPGVTGCQGAKICDAVPNTYEFVDDVGATAVVGQ
jgi:hypothetical protein